MKSDKEVIEQVDEVNQTHEGGAKKGTSNVKNYTPRCTGVGLHNMFVALPEEKKGALRTTCFAPLLLIDPIMTMSTLVVEIFDRHLDDVLQLNLLKIILSFLFPNKGRNVGVKYVDLRNHIEVPVIEPPSVGAPVVSVPTVGAPVIGSSSTTTEIGAVVVRECSQLEEYGKMLLKLDDHGKMLQSHGKMLKQISMSPIRYCTLPLGDTPLLGQYQFFTPEKAAKRKREEENLLKQFTHGEGLEVVKDLAVDDDVEVGMEVNLEAMSSEYGGGLLEWKKDDKKDDEDEKNVEEKVKSVAEEQPQVTKKEEVQEMEESKNGDEKVNDVEKDGEEKESKEGQP
ncbi:hypothetical protein GIB67_006511 [Kingdonia uniflora]|uniref:Uncharacterized protein n=1 Tax=Kingdonia uniflora TaxID=39325 RepID=A0A7J7LEI8_9MAGN|nr:hypothetical protein GIB67_006511 [Kingdonia uniflora]